MIWVFSFMAVVLAIGVSLNLRSAAEGVNEGMLAPCPASPNCVCSQDSDPLHAIEPLPADGEDPMERLLNVIREMPRTAVITKKENYLHVTFRSKVFQFLDDAEFYYVPEDGVIHVRSSSRMGYSDLGVNRARVEDIRKRLSSVN
jgi:uncharacterized protein (DUF1499 family)